MTFNEWLTSTLGTAGILTALIAALWKVIISRVTASVKSQYDKELETHIDKLRLQTDLILKDFESKANEKSIKLSKTFDKQAEVIVTTYKILVELYSTIGNSIFFRDRSKPADAEKEGKINELRGKFHRYFQLNKIYLPRASSLKLTNFEAALVREKINFDCIMDEYPTSHPERGRQKMAVYDKFNKEIPEMLKQLEDDLQNLLGFPPPETKNPPAKV